jgi:carboxyl-terminal processing protease
VENVWRDSYNVYMTQVNASDTDEFPEIVRTMLADLPTAAVAWQTRDERIAQDLTVSNRYEGIGAYIAYRDEPNPHHVLLSVVPNSPAAKAGLSAHESVIAIDGVPVSREEGSDAVMRIRGTAGTQLILTIRSPAGRQRDVIVVREKLIASGEVQAGVVTDTNIGYLLFPVAPYENMAEDVLDDLQRITGSGIRNIDGLILDLRISRANTGWPLGEMLALFSDGELGELFTREASEAVVIQGQNMFGSQFVPLAILIGPDTQGLPEVFAAMMQAKGRAQTFGLPTQGNIERLDEFPMPDGSRVFIATASYRTPDGQDVGLYGVNPSVRVDADWDQVTDGFDQVVNQAVNHLRSGSLEGQ